IRTRKIGTDWTCALATRHNGRAGEKLLELECIKWSGWRGFLGTIARSSASEIAARQQGAKRFDFRRYELGEGPHSGSVLHVVVHEQVEGHNQPDIVNHTNEVAFVVALKVRHRR